MQLTTNDPREQIIMKLGLDPVLAHETLFPHRHTEQTQPFHKQMILDWHSLDPNVLDLIFRGGAKSSIAEEAIVLMSCFRRFHNGLIIGETETRAKERLASIKHEFEFNEDIMAIFGDMKGPKWQETIIELSNGIVLQAYGRGQSLRGVKHLHYRPDIAFLDDLEDEESVRTKEARDKTMDWFTKTLLPAMAPKSRLRMAATPLDNEALAIQIEKKLKWTTRTIPICYIDPDDGKEKSSWPDRYSIEQIKQSRADYESLGKLGTWMQEYMMLPENPADKIFTKDNFIYAQHVRSWQPTYAVYDPARTVKATSANTGKVVGSWVGSKLIIWQSSAKFWKPDEIINDIFETDERFNPIAIGVEEDGLHEFILQPLRHAQIERSHLVPIRPLKAPKGKMDFIKSLQPFFKAHEIEFAGSPEDFAELTQQLLGFPTGKIDAPNALAYFLRLRPGLPIFEDFGARHIQEEIPIVKRCPLYLCLNANQQCTVGCFVQVYDGLFTILADFVFEGDPGAALPLLVRDASARARHPFTAIAPASHFQPYDTIGLRPAGRRIPLDIQSGGDGLRGREELRQSLRRLVHSREALRIASTATWALRAFSGGYARDFGKTEPNEGVYKVLCEGLESFAATLQSGTFTEMDKDVNYAYTADGRRYISALAR